jgi:hypothetical protein
MFAGKYKIVLMDKRLFFTLCLVFSTFLFAGCISNSEISQAEKKQIEEEAKQMLDNYFTDVHNKGMMAEFKYLDSTAEFFWMPPGYSSMIPYDSIARIIRQNATKFRSVNNTWDTLYVSAIDRHIVMYAGRINSVITDTTNKESRFKLLENGLIVKRKDGWKLLNGHTSMLMEINDQSK